MKRDPKRDPNLENPSYTHTQIPMTFHIRGAGLLEEVSSFPQG